VTSFLVRTKLPKDHFALDEAVPLEVMAVNQAGGPMPAPVIDGQGATVIFELRHDGGEPVFMTPARDPSRRPAPRPVVAAGVPVKGTIDLRELAGPLAPGKHSVVAVLEPSADRSAPVEFVVERAVLHAAVVAPASTTGEEERSVLRLEARGQDDLLVAVIAVRGGRGEVDRVAVDLGAASPSSLLALSVGPPRTTDPRAWALALDGRKLARRFIDEEQRAQALPEIAVPAAEPALVGALAGSLEPDPRLHVAFLDGARLLVLDAPNAAAPSWHETALAAEPEAICLSSLDETTRFAFLARQGDEAFSVELVPWTDGGLGAAAPLLAAKGTLVGIEAVASPEGDLVRLFAVSRPDAPDLALAVDSATVAADGRVAREETRVFRPEQLPDIEAVRVRAVWERPLFLLGRDPLSKTPLVATPGSREPGTVAVAPGELWDVECSRAGFLAALSVDPESGLRVRPVEMPR
jgi:hypothetical protein